MQNDESMQENAARIGMEQTLFRERRICDGIMQATDVMLVYLDLEFNFLTVNPAYAASCRIGPEEIIGKNHFALFPDPENEEIFRRVRDTGEAVFYKDKPFEFPDQPERGVTYWDWSLVPAKNVSGAVEGLVFSLRETTRYKLLELALRRSEEQYRSLFENMLNGFCYCEMIFDDDDERPVDFRFLETNPAFESMSGFTDVVGKRATEVIPGIREAHPELMAAFGRVAGTAVPEKFEIYFIPTGRWFDVSAYSSRKGFVAIIFENITERKQVEEMLRENAEKERLRAVELEAANRAKDDFVANMSHEIRTPLTGILGMLHRLGGTALDPRQEEYRSMAETSGKTLLRVINDILDFSRIEAGKMEIVPNPFNLRQCVQGAVDIFTPAAENKNLSLTFSCPVWLAEEVVGDCDRVSQLMFNLIGNALKFTERGSIRVSVQEVDEGEKLAREPLFRISVADTGIGIPAEKLESIFESFFQVGSGISRNYSGSGLGLAISRHLVKLMGGEISVESEIGRGSTFTVTLPLPAASPARRVKNLSGEQSRGGKMASERKHYRVLVAEDDSTIRKLLELILLDRGYEVDLAQNGAEAIELWEKGGADLILMDVQMPFMDGLAATVRIRHGEKETGEHVPIISLTAHAFADDSLRCFEAGADAYLSKPLNFQELFKTLGRYLD